MASDYRTTDSHIYFWKSVLSNHDTSCKFSGARTMEILLPRLTGVNHPPADSVSTRLILEHIFNCGEQFMMACKAWLFDRAAGNSTLKSILATPNPMAQKKQGRKVNGFNDSIWTRISVDVVVASLVARAEVSNTLANLYEFSGTRTFVEGSPSDTIWGVGIHWKDKAIEDEKRWKGGNRLGICHGMAREILRKQEMRPAVPMLIYRGPCRRCGWGREEDGEFSQPHAPQESDCKPNHWAGGKGPKFGTPKYRALGVTDQRPARFKERDLELRVMIEEEEKRVAACEAILAKEDGLPLDDLSDSTFIRYAGMSGKEQLEAFAKEMVAARAT